MYIQLLSAATATNSAPSGATAGFAVARGGIPGAALQGGYFTPGIETVVLVKNTAGSGTMTVTLKLWGYNPTSAAWHPLGTNSDAALKGVLNDGNAMAETAADTISHSEVILGLSVFTRVYLEITAIGGTGTAISAWLVAG